MKRFFLGYNVLNYKNIVISYENQFFFGAPKKPNIYKIQSKKDFALFHIEDADSESDDYFQF